MAERPEDLNLPNAVVSRIIKEALPPNVKVSKEAQAAVAKAASVFVLYATSCANNVASNAHRKTLNGSDVIKAMEDMEFHKFIDPLESSLESWKESQQKKKDSAKQKREAKKEQSKKEDDEEEEVVEVDPNADTSENKENAKSDEEDEVQEVQEVDS